MTGSRSGCNGEHGRGLVRFTRSGWVGRVALEEGDATEATRAVCEVLDHVAGGGTLEGTEDARMIEWTLFRILAAANDSRAAEWLARAHDALQAQAAQLADAECHDRGGYGNSRPYRNARGNDQAAQITGLVNDLLDVGRVATGKIHLQSQAVDVGAIAEAAASAMNHPGVRGCAHSPLSVLRPLSLWVIAFASSRS